MRITNEEMMRKANEILLSYNQTILVKKWTGKEVEFINGIVIKNNERIKFMSRIFNKKTDLWKKHHDEVLLNPYKVSVIKSILSKIGGEKCQNLYGEKIKLNLNTGVPWNKGTIGMVSPWNKGLTKNEDQRLLKFSETRLGDGNPCYGKKYSEEEKKLKSDQMKEKILNGKFTPKSNNRNTHWESSFLDKKYRSSWEAWYQYLSPTSEFENLRIQYSINNITKIYIVDFIDRTNKIVAEVKPVEMTKDKIFKAKWNALTHWANVHGYETKLITAAWLKENTITIDYSLFDIKTSNKIKKIYEINKEN
jgi:hypothetical protein